MGLLSEYIRLGAMLRPQAFGWFFKDGGSCAIGGVLEASGLRAYEEMMKSGPELQDQILARFPLLSIDVTHAQIPVKSGWIYNVWSAIVTLNNEPNCWSRERIADWVEGIERECGLIPAEQAEEELIEVMV